MLKCIGCRNQAKINGNTRNVNSVRLETNRYPSNNPPHRFTFIVEECMELMEELVHHFDTFVRFFQVLVLIFCVLDDP